MKQDRWRKIEQIYHQALRQDPDERADFVKEGLRVGRDAAAGDRISAPARTRGGPLHRVPRRRCRGPVLGG